MPEACPTPAGPLAQRQYGVLLHPTSLPGAGKWGALGRAADHFMDWLRLAGARVWQVLPLGPVGDDGSPYFARSTHAGNPRLIDVEALAADGWLASGARGAQASGEWHAGAVAAAAGALLAAPKGARRAYEEWTGAQAYWLDDYALSVVLRERHGGKPWWAWEPALRDREPAALRAVAQREAAGLDRIRAEQFFFHQQWQSLRERARARGLRLFGDLPIYLAPDATDVWVERELFELELDGLPVAVAGVPPDYFSEEGQRWGNPLYRWSRHQASGFRWWISRLAAEFALCDLVRIDHFRALEAYWAVPAGASARHGEWRPAPGAELLSAARTRFGELPLVAEDLGVITPAVEALRDAFGLPGMRVLQFGFDGDPANPHLPHNWHPNLVAYTGTHDNDTLSGWAAQLDDATHGRVAAYVGSGDLPAGLLRLLMASVARLAVVPMQDLLRLDSAARMNTPGTVDGNWHWKMDWSHVAPDLARRTRELAHRYGRTAD